MNEIDPILFGRLLERMDQQDEMLEKVLAEMKCLKTDVHTLKNRIHTEDQHRQTKEKWTTAFWSALAFVVGNALQWYIFRGPGHS